MSGIKHRIILLIGLCCCLYYIKSLSTYTCVGDTYDVFSNNTCTCNSDKYFMELT